jgi:hypothetical protein
VVEPWLWYCRAFEYRVSADLGRQRADISSCLTVTTIVAKQKRRRRQVQDQYTDHTVRFRYGDRGFSRPTVRRVSGTVRILSRQRPRGRTNSHIISRTRQIIIIIYRRRRRPLALITIII